ncbi:MAG: DsbE family thiol:disulfide interchange protein [Gammaproteobacteria bacterium]
MARFLIPLAIFASLVVLLWAGLGLNPREVPSPLIGKPAPQFALPTLHAEEKTLSKQDLLGTVYLLNVWASWCVACRQEHPLYLELARSNQIPIYGLNYKDTRHDALRWLTLLGNPYQDSIFDQRGHVGFDLGVYGVPETFLVDRIGIIRYKHIGPITEEVLRQEILPLAKQLQAAPLS